jgi:hypothetical protein
LLNAECKILRLLLFYDVLIKDNSAFAARALYTKLSTSFIHLSTGRHVAMQITDDNLSAAIYRALRRVRHLKASDPRDKIFGILGLCSAFGSLLPKPDYSMTESDVFCEVARALILHSQSLQILAEANEETSLVGHPSWVPHWSIPAIVGLPTESARCYNASRNSNAEFEISSNNKELWVAGKGIDVVEKTSLASSTAYDFGASDWQRIAGWQASCSLGLSLTEYPTGEPVREALWRTLCWNVAKTDQYPAPADKKVIFEEWYRVLTADEEPKRTSRELEAHRRFNELVRSRRAPLCITEKGFLASAPYTTEVGDRIVVLSGARLPFVLRPVEDHYKLIGPCYVHGAGIMDGEAFPENPEELEWFSIW